MANHTQDFYGTPDEDGLTAEGIQDERYLSDALDEAHALDAENYFAQDSNFDNIAEDEFGFPAYARMDDDEQAEFDQAAEDLQNHNAFGPDFF